MSLLPVGKAGVFLEHYISKALQLVLQWIARCCLSWNKAAIPSSNVLVLGGEGSTLFSSDWQTWNMRTVLITRGSLCVGAGNSCSSPRESGPGWVCTRGGNGWPRAQVHLWLLGWDWGLRATFSAGHVCLCTHCLPGEQEKALEKVLRVAGNLQAGSLQVACCCYTLSSQKTVKGRSVHTHPAFERGMKLLLVVVCLGFFSLRKYF